MASWRVLSRHLLRIWNFYGKQLKQLMKRRISGFLYTTPTNWRKYRRGSPIIQYCHDDGRLRGCVMAMVGRVMRTRCPNKEEVLNQMSFMNSKGLWGLVIFAGCGDKLTFTTFCAKCPGATNDSQVWEMSDFLLIWYIRVLYLLSSSLLWLTRQFQWTRLCSPHLEVVVLVLGEFFQLSYVIHASMYRTSICWCFDEKMGSSLASANLRLSKMDFSGQCLCKTS